MRFLGMTRSPDLFEQKAMREDFTGVLDERCQQLVLQRREMHRLLTHHDLPGPQIDGELTDSKDRRRISAARGVPQRGPHPGQQLGDAKRLGDVVVRSAIQGLHLLRLLVPRGKHNDGRGQPFAQAP